MQLAAAAAAVSVTTTVNVRASVPVDPIFVDDFVVISSFSVSIELHDAYRSESRANDRLDCI